MKYAQEHFMSPIHRNVNLDLLKCLAMYCVVVLHFFGYGIRFSDNPSVESLSGGVFWVNYLISQLFTVICSAGVNLFVLITGFFLISKPFNWKRMILLWWEVLFYGFVIALLFAICKPGIIQDWTGLVGFMLPISGNQYWFYTYYVGLVLLAPFLSVAVNHFSKAQYKRLLVVIILLGCTITLSFPFGKVMGVSKGFSLIWFVFLFFCGGYFRRFPVGMLPRQAFYAFGSVCLLGWLFVISKMLIRHTVEIEAIAYNSFGFFLSIFLFIFFSNRGEIKGIAIKRFTSCVPYLFAVYLISDHPFVRRWLWFDLFEWTSLIDKVYFIPVMLVVTLGIFVSCIMVDYLRVWLFKMIGMERMAEWLGKKGSAVMERI